MTWGSSTINDPLYACQWHLNSSDSAGMDINVESVWAGDITGAGVNVAVVDYTIDHSHDDLSANINSALNHDYGDRSNAYRPADHHGTYVAGVLAARDNTIGVRGVAPRATIYGYNLLADGEAYFTDANTANAMVRNRVATAVSNNSWGPVDGFGFDHAPAVWEIAIDTGVTQGDGRQRGLLCLGRRQWRQAWGRVYQGGQFELRRIRQLLRRHGRVRGG